MEPATVGARLASAAVAPLIRKLFARPGPGAELTGGPVRIGSLLSLRGEQRVLGERELTPLAQQLVRRAAEAYGPRERPVPAGEEEALALAVARTLASLGTLTMDDVQAVRLGPEAFAHTLRTHAPDAARDLSADAEALYEQVVDAAALHLLNFFTQRSTFVARTLVEQSRMLSRQAAVLDLLCERLPAQSAEDARFERQYAAHIVRKHSELTIYGLDLRHSGAWQLDAAYIPLEAAHDSSSAAPLPAERALRGHGRVLLRGGAGSGKTTLVQWLAVTTARQTYDEHLTHLIGRVPFVLPLRRVVRDGLPPTPDRFLHAVRSSVAGAQPAGWADRVLRAGRGLLLVDGIDEIPEREREETRRWLHELMGDFPGNLWLVTGRPSAVGEDWPAREGFTELTLAPMARRDVGDFVRRWHTAAGADPELARALLDAVRTHGDLARLAVTPLMCGLLCALHRERRGFLPHSRKELYEAALAMLLERRDRERAVTAGAGLRLSKDSQIQLLQKLAHWMIRNDRSEMDRSDAVARLERALTHMGHVTATPGTVYRHLLERSGLLREPAENRVDFVHRTFQDYLGAKAVVEEGDFPLLLDNAHRDQWEDVIRMAVAHARPAERARLLNGLVGEPTGDREPGPSRSPFRTILLATACLEHATELEHAVREHITALADALLPPSGSGHARALAEHGGPLVLGLLPGPEGLPEKKAEAVVITATRIATDAALPLLARYRRHPSLAVRRQLTWAWHRFDAEVYAEEIIAHLPEDGLYFAVAGQERLRALRALGGRSRVQVLGTYAHEVLAEHLVADRLTHLWLRDGYTPAPDGSEWLDAFPRLHTLVLPEGSRRPAGRTDLTVLEAGTQ